MAKRRRKRTITDTLEFALARLTGRASWPCVDATLESELTLQSSNAAARMSGSSFDCFTYEVDGVIYASGIRRFWWRRNYRSRLPEAAWIQYNPRNPKKAYYAPAHTLLNNFAAVLSGATLVACFLWFL